MDHPASGRSVKGASTLHPPAPYWTPCPAPGNGIAMNRQPTLAKNNDVPREWVIIDAADQILGRLSTQIATILMGK
ncbi:MAG: uL13 family ribosomal protein, partial [Planctomycetota bacterium]